MRRKSGIVRLAAVALFFGVSSWAHAAWVGVMLHQTPGIDHIHVTVSENYAANESAGLNIWDGYAYKRSLTSEMERASDFIIFRSKRSKNEILNFWKNYYENNRSTAHILFKNCADASRQVINFALDKPVPRNANLAHIVAFIYLPNFMCPITLPQSVFKQTKDHLKSERVEYYSYQNYERFGKARGLGLKDSDTFRAFSKSLPRI